MVVPLLKTKLVKPLLSPHLVARPLLIDRLENGLRLEDRFVRKLTLVSAPPGFGKTTLAAAWLGEREGSWISLDAGDNDPARFLAYLVLALQQLDAQIGQAAAAMLRAPQRPPAEAVLATLINDLADLSRPVFLILDDYHTIQNQALHRLAAFLLEHLPGCAHLVILTREDPFLPLARLRSRGELLEIREADLRFTLAESAAFLQRMLDPKLSREELELLHGRTEGWVTGLQLAGLSMRASPDVRGFIQSFAGSNRYILDYLFEETFTRQPPDVQDFLLRTSVLDRFCARLCDALLGREDSAARLSELERANLFVIPLDPDREWYRYHHLFADLLAHQLRQRKDIRAGALQLRAAAWFEAEGDLVSAVPYVLAAKDWSAAGRLLGPAGDLLLKQGQAATLIDWMRRIPLEIVSAQPRLALGYAWALLLAGQLEQAGGLLSGVESAAPAGSALLGLVSAAQAYLARACGDDQRLIETSQRALALLPPSEAVSRGNVALSLGLAYWHAGDLDEAENALQEACRLGAQTGNHYAVLAGKVFLARTEASRGRLRLAAGMYQSLLQHAGRTLMDALVYYDLCSLHTEWNQLETAAEHLRAGLEISRGSGNLEFENTGMLLEAALAMAQGDAGRALAAAERSVQLSEGLSPAVRSRAAACRVSLALALGDLNAAEDWAGQVIDGTDAHLFYRFLGLSRARLLLAQRKKKEAAGLLAGAYANAETAGWGYGLIILRILQALAAPDPAAALVFLCDALRRGEPQGYLRAFLDAYPGGGRAELGDLLREAARRGYHPEYAGRILALLDQAAQKQAVRQEGLLEPLSERELEVLRLVTAGLSNREIAQKLVISPGTAKTHIHHICTKLAVRSRTEAAVRARDLGLC